MKKIGVIAKIQPGGTVGIGAQYWDYFSEIGEIVMINPLVDTVADVDLLVLPGGPDLRMYKGEKPSAHTGRPDVFLDYFDMNCLDKYVKAKVPIFGICRGFQAINAHFGGSIVQHVRMKESFNRYEPVEEVLLPDDTKMKVNSMHHQAVYVDDLAECLVPIAISEAYGNVEALHHKDLQIFGVQWHPEELDESDDSSYFVRSKILSMLGMEEVDV